MGNTAEYFPRLFISLAPTQTMPFLEETISRLLMRSRYLQLRVRFCLATLTPAFTHLSLNWSTLL